MKKLIAILVIAIVLVGAVFAETHTLTVRTTVNGIIPAFQLRYGTGDVYTNKTADDNTTSVIDAATQFSATGTFGEVNDYDDGYIQEAEDISLTDVTADFYAVLAIGGKQENVSYKLTFEAGAFNTKVNGVQDSTTETACTSSTIAVAENYNATTHGAIVTLAQAASAITNNPANSKAWVITMKGAPATSKIDLVKFTPTWGRNPNVDIGNYTANVTLTITVEQ